MKEIALKFPNTELMANFLIDNNIRHGQTHSHLKIITGVFSFTEERLAKEKYSAVVEAPRKKQREKQKEKE